MAKKISRLQRIRAEIEAFRDESIFRREGELSRLYKFLHFWLLVTRSFIRNRCPIRASALSYTTLLALIPMLAVAMSVTTALLKKEGKNQIEHLIETFVSKMVPPAGDDADNPPELSLSTTNQPSNNPQNVGVTNFTNTATNFAVVTSNTNSIAASTSTTNNASSTPTREKGPDSGESRLTAAQKK